MKLVQAIAVDLRECGIQWPEGAEKVKQQSSYYVEFSGENLEESEEYDWEEFEIGTGLNWMDEYDDDGEVVTKAEYDAFTASPTWYEDLMAKRPALIAEIADLNKKMAALANKISALAEEAGVDISFNLGQHGDVDPNSERWNASMC